MPDSADALREQIIGGNSQGFASTANVAYQMPVDEYRRYCPYVDEVEREWGTAPGKVNSFGQELLIQGVQLGNVFVGVQPTFGYEGDPMRLMMARGGAPHHGFMAFYTYLSMRVECGCGGPCWHAWRDGVYAGETSGTFRSSVGRTG